MRPPAGPKPGRKSSQNDAALNAPVSFVQNEPSDNQTKTVPKFLSLSIQDGGKDQPCDEQRNDDLGKKIEITNQALVDISRAEIETNLKAPNAKEEKMIFANINLEKRRYRQTKSFLIHRKQPTRRNP